MCGTSVMVAWNYSPQHLISNYSVMELLHPSLLLTFFLFLLMLIKFHLSKARNTNAKLPPGPSRLPIIGSLHHLLGAPTHQALRALAYAHGPIMHLKLGETSLVAITSPEAAREILKTHDITFATRPLVFAPKIITYGGRDIIFAPYGEYWRQMRKLCVVELLSTKRVESFHSIREEEALALMRTIRSMGSSPVNMSQRLSFLTSDITSRAAFGNKCKDKKKYIEAMEEVFSVGGWFSLVDMFPSSTFLTLVTGAKSKIERCHRRIDKILDDIIHERKMWKTVAATKDDEVENLLDVLLTLQESGEFGLSDDAIKAVVFDMFQAGTGTSSRAMAWALAELIRNPGVMEKAQAEVRQLQREKQKLTEEDIRKLHYLKLVIKETLRLHPSAPLLVPRECTETCTVLGYDIPAKTRVVVNAWAIGRDPKYWNDPEEFRPERFEGSAIDFKGTHFEYIPFGAGRRICPGMQFGLEAMETTLAHLLCYFNWKLPNGLEPHELDMSDGSGAGGHRKFALLLCANPYIPLPVS